jgi:hypothetical protein
MGGRKKPQPGETVLEPETWGGEGGAGSYRGGPTVGAPQHSPHQDDPEAKKGEADDADPHEP